ncbi:MAG: Holliday junction ATP-dependent DNA helicase RuvB [Verrucomicrobiae bacterium]|nr:Holliday junction ATP-dependent DNA helicase RuvB [Verrucomicrobiae bacterium]
MNALRPATLDQFVGQESVRRILSVLIAAARKRNEPVPHLLMSGPPGLGKTSLARIVAHEMKGRLTEMVGSTVKQVSDMSHHLLQLRPNDVLFIDEIHALPRKVEEVLYGAMEDNAITVEQRGFNDLMRQIGVAHGDKSVTTHRLPPFSLLGATTKLGSVTAPLRARFRQVIELRPYAVSELQRIVTVTAEKLQFALPEEIAMQIAQRSRGTARVAVSHLMWLRDVVMGDGGVATMELLRQAFELKGIDENGLGQSDREYLHQLIKTDEALGADTLATALGESVETVTDSIEPYLMQSGFVQRTSRGRMATDKARELLKEATA